MQAWLTGMDVADGDQGAKLVSPYMQSAWVYIAISVIAETLAGIPFRISRISGADARRVRALRWSNDGRQRRWSRRALGENILDSGPAVELFESPHKTMGRTLFWEQVVTWDCLRGEFFVMPLDKTDEPVDLADRAPRVARMITLNPDLFWHMVIGYELEAWRYTGQPLMSPIPSEMLSPTEVVHCRNVNPYLFWRGMSPLLIAMLPASSDYAAEMFMKGLLMNNADTGIIATTEQNLTPEQREQFAAALRERKRKAGTPDRPLFLSSGVKIEKPTISNVDMQFLETRRLLRQEIGAIYKVPESMMGFSSEKQSSLSGGGNAISEERVAFIENNIQMRCRRYEGALQPIVATFGDGLIGWFDVDGLPIMQEARRSRLDAASKAFAMGVPLNDINRVYDLGFPEYAWGEKGWLPFNLQPADAAAELPGEELPADETANDSEDEAADESGETPMAGMRRLLAEVRSPKSEVRSPEQKTDTAALWRRHVRARAGVVKVFERKIGKVLNEFRGKVLGKIDTVHLEGLNSEDGKAGSGVEKRSLVDLVFNAAEFGNALKVVLERPIRAALSQAVNEARQEVGADPWEMPPKEVAEFIRAREQPIMGVGGTVRGQLNTSLEAGFDAGETTTELAARVKEVFNDLTDGEAVRVARTETGIAFETARDKALKAAGIEYKAWLSSHGPRVRPGHAEAEATYIDEPIPSDEPFIVDLDGDGEQLMYPGDDSLGASPGNIINCQCVRLAAQKAGEDGESTSYRVFGLGMLKYPKSEVRGPKEGRSPKSERKHICTS